MALASATVLTSCQLITTVTASPHEFPDNVAHLSSDRIDQLVDALVRQDADDVKSLFSPGAQAEAVGLDAGIQELLAVFAGKLDWASGNNSRAAEFIYSGADGKYWKYYAPFCAKFIDGREYQIYVLEYVENTIEPDLVGVYGVRADNAPGACSYKGDLFDHASIDVVTAEPGRAVAGIVVNGGETP